MDDTTFQSLLNVSDPVTLDQETKKFLHTLELCTVTEEIDGDYFTIEPQLESFLQQKDASRINALCRQKLSDPKISCFFEDIRNKPRRKRMVQLFLEIAKVGKSEFISQVEANFQDCLLYTSPSPRD